MNDIDMDSCDNYLKQDVFLTNGNANDTQEELFYDSDTHLAPEKESMILDFEVSMRVKKILP
jgi:hypothetical protein